MSVQDATLPERYLHLPEFLEQRGDEEIYLKGHRITLEDVCLFYNEGCTAEMLRDQFPTLPLVLIHKVIVFYLENRTAVEDYLSKCQTARDANFERWHNSPRIAPDAAQLRRRMQARQTAAGAN